MLQHRLVMPTPGKALLLDILRQELDSYELRQADFGTRYDLCASDRSCGVRWPEPAVIGKRRKAWQWWIQIVFDHEGGPLVEFSAGLCCELSESFANWPNIRKHSGPIFVVEQ